jgi:hypothetical protein
VTGNFAPYGANLKHGIQGVPGGTGIFGFGLIAHDPPVFCIRADCFSTTGSPDEPAEHFLCSVDAMQGKLIKTLMPEFEIQGGRYASRNPRSIGPGGRRVEPFRRHVGVKKAG